MSLFKKGVVRKNWCIEQETKCWHVEQEKRVSVWNRKNVGVDDRKENGGVGEQGKLEVRGRGNLVVYGTVLRVSKRGEVW